MDQSKRCRFLPFQQVMHLLSASEHGAQICGCRLRLELLHPALSRRLVRAPAQQAGSVPESIARDLVVGHFDDELRLQRLPLAASLGAPAAGAAGRTAREAGRRDQRLASLRQLRPIGAGSGGGDADMVELALGIIKTQEQPPDLPALRGVAEAADNAVRAT